MNFKILKEVKKISKYSQLDSFAFSSAFVKRGLLIHKNVVFPSPVLSQSQVDIT